MMKYIIAILLVMSGLVARAQLPSSTFPSRVFNGNTKAQWLLLDSPVVNPILDTFHARYPGTQIVRIQGGDTAFWFYGGNRRWFRSLFDRDTVSLSNRINLKLNISDTANRWWGIGKRWVDSLRRVNDSTIGYSINGSEYTIQILGRLPSGGGGSGTVTSVGLSMPSAFTVTGSPVTGAGTISVSGAGTSTQYMRGNGTLGTTDTGMIPDFHLKVRSLISGSSPITFNQTTGIIGINNANTSGTKGAASFTGAFSDNGSGLIDLLDRVATGSCTNCNVTYNSKGLATAYSNGTGSTNRVVDTLFRTPGVDSIYFTINGTQYAIKDSSGAGGSVTSVTGTTNRITVTNPTTTPVVDIAATYVGQSSITTLGTITTGIWNGTAIGATFGGTGQTSVTTGDLLYGSATNTWSKLAGVATGNALISGGVATAPSWGKIGLTTHISGILPVANGGTGTATPSLVAGTDISITGTWPNQTINAIGGGSGTVTQVNTGYGLTGGPITTTGTATVDTNTIDLRYYNVINVKSFGAVGDSVTDDGPAIQAAINYAFTHYKDIYFPAGYYSVNTAVQDSVNGRECRCQLYIPYSASDSARTIRFIAENATDFEVIGIDGMPVSKKGVIIQSALTGQADTTFILGVVKGPGSGTFSKMNQTTPIIEGINFRTRLDAGVNGIGGLNFTYASKVVLDHVKIDINMPIFNMPDVSVSGSVGILLPTRGNHAQTEIGSLRIVGYNRGMSIEEHTVAQDLQIVACYVGAVYQGGDHSSSIQTFEAELNQYNLFYEGVGQLVILNYNSEHYTTADKWFQFVSDVYFNNTADYSRLTLGNYSASNSGTGATQFAPTTNHPELVNVLGAKFQSNLPENFMSAMLGEFSTSPGRAILQLNDLTQVADSKRSLLYNASGSISWAFASDDGLTQNRFFNVEHAGLSAAPVINIVTTTLKVGSTLSLGATDAKLEVTTPDAVGIRVNMSNTTPGTTAVQFNRASTSVENSFNWSTNGTNKWFMGQDNNSTDNLYLYSWTANKFAAILFDATGDIGFGNAATDLYIKNGSAVLVNTNSDNGIGKLQLNGKITVSEHDLAADSDSALIWNRATNEYEYAKVNGGSATTIYSGDGALGGNRTVTGSSNSLTFDGIFNFRVNANSVLQSKTGGGVTYSTSVSGADNSLHFGYTPVPTVYSKGSAIILDTNNNVGLGTSAPTTMPLYATGTNAVAGNLMVGGSQFDGIATITSNITLDLTKYYIRIDASGGNVTVTLPAASTGFGAALGIHYVFKRLDNSGNSITITRAGSDTVDGGTSITLTTQYEVKELICSSTSTWDVR